MFIGELQKNSFEFIRVSNAAFSGREYVDIRTYINRDGEDVIPTKKGITIPYDKVNELIELLKKVLKLHESSIM